MTMARGELERWTIYVCACVYVCVCARAHNIAVWGVHNDSLTFNHDLKGGMQDYIHLADTTPTANQALAVWKTKRGMNANTSISDYRHTGSHTNDRVDWTLVYKHDGTPGQSWQMFPGIRLSFTVCLAVLFISEDLLNHQRPFKTLRMLETFWERSVSIGQPWTTLFFCLVA
jgi:hypothetical protein